jgi:hypothetical protein
VKADKVPDKARAVDADGRAAAEVAVLPEAALVVGRAEFAHLSPQNCTLQLP